MEKLNLSVLIKFININKIIDFIFFKNKIEIIYLLKCHFLIQEF